MAILATLNTKKTFFDENNETHIDLYKTFLIANRWGASCCPFILKFPYLTVPDMIKDRLVHKFLQETIK